MRFAIITTGYLYSDDEYIAKLKKIGFEFIPYNEKVFTIKGSPVIEIKDLDELIEFSNKFGDIIVSEGCIEIYDDYRE